jgi:hypothetical protein
MNLGTRPYSKALAALLGMYIVALAGCHDDLELYVPPDAAPSDATGPDARGDAVADALPPEDATLDATPGTDSGTDSSGRDAGVDSSPDVGTDTGADAAGDAAGDAGADAADDGAADAADASADAADDGADGAACPVTVFNVVNSGASAYTINGVDNPTLSVCRGMTFTFNISSTGHPFFLKSIQGSGTGDAYTDGVTNNGVDTGTITWTVSGAAPTPLFYNCEFHPAMTGQINVN